MKYAAHIFELGRDHAGVAERRNQSQVSSYDSLTFEQSESNLAARPYFSAIKVAGVLAFSQSLIFLAVWLFLCASAGAATKPQAEFVPELKMSIYDPSKQRDPFFRPGMTTQDVKGGPSVPITLQLQGILYQSTNPSAIVNDKLLTLNKIVTLNAGNAEVPVKAVEITRDRVVLEIGGERVELRLNQQSPQATPPR